MKILIPRNKYWKLIFLNIRCIHSRELIIMDFAFCFMIFINYVTFNYYDDQTKYVNCIFLLIFWCIIITNYVVCKF